MWHDLRLESLGVITRAELEFGPGLTVITGETGAGKTMVVTALGLLRGERANMAMVRHGSAQARIEATVGLDSAEITELVRDAGGEVDGELVLGRVLSAAGRSRAIAGGATVPAGLLSKVTDHLVAVHGQSDQQRLVHTEQQRQALDRFGGDEVAGILDEFVPTYTTWREQQARLARWHEQSAERLQRLELLKMGLAEISDIAPESEEDEQLLAEENRLAHAESLAAAALGAAEHLTDADTNVGTLLIDALAALDGAHGHDAHLDAIAARVKGVSIDIADVASELHTYGSDIEMDPQRLALVQDRRALLTGLQRKYGPALADVIAWAENAAVEIAEEDLDESAVEAMTAEANRLSDAVEDLAARLTTARTTAATRLSAEIESELAELALANAKVEIQVTPGPITATGADQVQFTFAANSGTAPQPLGESASGGELSRLMLAIEVVLAGRSPVPTLVFDEVDAGIGGRTAIEVGRRLARLSEHAQVIAVTHLPQVAAFADTHFVVTKNDDGEVTESSVRRVSEEERIEELARMMSGLEDSSTAVAHARELLETAQG